ncbi:MAG: type II toxin-antitoxin system VapC family toxin [Hyphomicrobium sp.]
MILLDTNVVSAIMRLPLEPMVQAWLDRQDRNSLFTSAPTLFEIRFGIEKQPHGRRRRELEEIIDTLIKPMFNTRIIDFGSAAAEAAARIRASQIKRGLNPDIPDSQIAGIALHADVPLATRNTRDFKGLGIPLINPWEYLPAR